ncbi:MAG: hypothetical protein ACKOET_13290, partial [Verrucomicrobiota bacterium]
VSPATARTYDVELRLFYSENWGVTSPVMVDVTDAFGQAQLVVSPGSTARRMTGGGWVTNSFSRNGRATFGFEGQPAPKTKGTAQGNSTYMLHAVTLPEYPGKVWQLRVKDSAWSSSTLAFYAGTAGSTAVDSGRLQCNGVVQLVNSQNSAETISYGNCVIVVDVRDGGFYSPALPDLYAITVYDNKNNILWFSTPTKTALSRGEVRVFSK